MPEPSEHSTEEDDGFGDFDAAPPSVVDAARLPEPSVTPNEEEDGFGDFDGAPPPGPSIAPAADDDDGFGDFAWDWRRCFTFCNNLVSVVYPN